MTDAQVCKVCGEAFYSNGAHAERCHGPKVTLVGGPLNGEQRYGLANVNLRTFILSTATYRRLDEHTFEYCPTPTAVGDATDLVNRYEPPPLPDRSSDE